VPVGWPVSSILEQPYEAAAEPAVKPVHGFRSSRWTPGHVGHRWNKGGDHKRL